ncbi:tetratricopeptide repeat protein [Sphingobacteriaceae bacterium WQ 2009]|uniref:Tetratricopeptide repeat protein n=1 Tax=Rhinopithecimicrobium faecis TaxID=2820698 RepID=A0A8T4H711_9SPHI|nr:tetratricopeptide repeat protein [Sphingobacteriaceae bacterium WQ 2009]
MSILITWSRKWYALSGIVLASLFTQPLIAQTVNSKPYQAAIATVEGKLRAGQFPEALSLMDSITQEYPKADDVFFMRALVLGELRNMDAALGSVDQAIAISPKPNYLSYAITLTKNKGDFQKATNYIDLLIQQDPKNAANYREKMILLQYNKQPEEAFKLYETVKAEFGATDTLDLLYADLLSANKRPQEAKGILKSWVDKKTSIRPIYANLAQLYLDEGNKRGAMLLLEQAIPLVKDDYLYLDLADVYRENKKDKLAFDNLKKAFESMDINFMDKNRIIASSFTNNGLSFAQLLELTTLLTVKYPRIAEAHLLKGQALWMNNQSADARAQLLVAVGINPQQIDAWRMLMNVDLSLNEPAEAIRHGQEALSVNPNQPILLYFMGISHMVKEDLGNARSYLEAALNNAQRENNFLQATIYSSLGDVYHQLKMEAASDVAYREAINLDSTNVSALNNLSYYLSLRKKDLEFAAKSALAANELRPNDPTFQDTYAWVLFQQENYQEALVWIQKAVKGSKVPSAVLYEHYGDILVKNGRKTEAVKYWNLALTDAQKEGVDLERLKKKISTKSYVE